MPLPWRWSHDHSPCYSIQLLWFQFPATYVYCGLILCYNTYFLLIVHYLYFPIKCKYHNNSIYLLLKVWEHLVFNMYLLSEWVIKWIILLGATVQASRLPPDNKLCLSAPFVSVITRNSEIRNTQYMEIFLKKSVSAMNALYFSYLCYDTKLACLHSKVIINFHVYLIHSFWYCFV